MVVVTSLGPPEEGVRLKVENVATYINRKQLGLLIILSETENNNYPKNPSEIQLKCLNSLTKFNRIKMIPMNLNLTVSISPVLPIMLFCVRNGSSLHLGGSRVLGGYPGPGLQSGVSSHCSARGVSRPDSVPPGVLVSDDRRETGG